MNNNNNNISQSSDPLLTGHHLDIHLHSAYSLKGGSFLGASDFYCTFTLRDGKTAKTSSTKPGSDIQWNESFQMDLPTPPEEETLFVSVWGKKKLFQNTLIGRLEVPLCLVIDYTDKTTINENYKVDRKFKLLPRYGDNNFANTGYLHLSLSYSYSTLKNDQMNGLSHVPSNSAPSSIPSEFSYQCGSCFQFILPTMTHNCGDHSPEPHYHLYPSSHSPSVSHPSLSPQHFAVNTNNYSPPLPHSHTTTQNNTLNNNISNNMNQYHSNPAINNNNNINGVSKVPSPISSVNTSLPLAIPSNQNSSNNLTQPLSQFIPQSPPQTINYVHKSPPQSPPSHSSILSSNFNPSAYSQSSNPSVNNLSDHSTSPSLYNYQKIQNTLNELHSPFSHSQSNPSHSNNNINANNINISTNISNVAVISKAPSSPPVRSPNSSPPIVSEQSPARPPLFPDLISLNPMTEQERQLRLLQQIQLKHAH